MSTALDQLRARLLEGVEPTPLHARPAGNRQAAVLLLFSGQDDPGLTFVERAHGMRHHPGQIAFPGGGLEPGETPTQAALREAHEEVGLEPGLAQVLGTLPAAGIPASDNHVTPVVAQWQHEVPLRVADTLEVAAVHTVHVSELTAPKARLQWNHGGFVGPGFHVGDLFIWGFTGLLLAWVLDLAGWSRPWDRRNPVDVPERFRR